MATMVPQSYLSGTRYGFGLRQYLGLGFGEVYGGTVRGLLYIGKDDFGYAHASI